MPSRLTITPPGDYVLARDVCSYGYFLLHPNRWDPASQAFERALDIDGRVVRVRITQPSGDRGSRLSVRCDAHLSRDDRALIRRSIDRMLHLSGAGSEQSVRVFHKLDPRFRRSGRGRLLRSPTLFEDVVKTVTSCNVAWPSTITMNRRLCEVINPAFPRPAQLARRKPASLRARCRVGYRDERLVKLAQLAGRKTSILHPSNERVLTDESLSDADAMAMLLELPGIGPYAAANIMQLLGRYSYLPIDTETHRHAASVLGFRETGRALTRRIEAHYQRFGAHRFRSYWFELWNDYERKRGKAWAWDRETTGRTFTASQLG